MSTPFAGDMQSSTSRVSQAFRALATVLVFTGFLAAPVASRGAELKQETLKSWDTYVQAENARLEAGQGSFFHLDAESDDLRRLRAGQILVLPVGHPNPKPVPSGLIHDWIGTAFIPDTTMDSVLSTVRDYADYKKFYKSSVLDSKRLATNEGCDTYSLRVANEERLAHTALDMENQTCYFRVDQQRWYSVTQTTRVQEIRKYGMPNQEELPPGQGSGYLWRMYSIARFEEKDGGVYVQVEAIALSRNIPVAVRWMIDPIVRHVSRTSMFLSLQQTRQAVVSTMAGAREGRPPMLSQERSPGVTGSEGAVANSFPVPHHTFTKEPLKYSPVHSPWG